METCGADGLADLLRSTGVDVEQLDELGGGHQSRVFRLLDRDGASTIAKVLDATGVVRAQLDARLRAVTTLAEIDTRVCRPLAVGDDLVLEWSTTDGRRFLVTCSELARGTEPDPTEPADAHRMGVALSELHVSMGRLSTSRSSTSRPSAAELDVVAALRTVPVEAQRRFGPHQLLHGDFQAANLRLDGDVVRIFDLDDCGIGPPAFDVANALYMEWFDRAVRSEDVVTVKDDTAAPFRRAFLDGYAAGPAVPIVEADLDALLDLRTGALRCWLDDLDSAPIGIRTADPTWHATLRSVLDR